MSLTQLLLPADYFQGQQLDQQQPPPQFQQHQQQHRIWSTSDNVRVCTIIVYKLYDNQEISFAESVYI